MMMDNMNEKSDDNFCYEIWDIFSENLYKTLELCEESLINN